MDYKKFAEDYEGEDIDFDGMYGAQCVDAVRFFWQKVHNIPRHLQPDTKPSGGAKDLINNVKLPLKVTQEPKPGDVVVFGETPANRFGHVAIVMEVGEDYLEVVEQIGLNDKEGSRGDGRGLHWRIRPLANIAGFITI